jgi:DNA-binding beta-propeller fold protein YncE
VITTLLLSIALAAPADSFALADSTGLGAAADSAATARADSLAVDSVAVAPERLVLERSFGRYGVGPGELSSPGGLAVDPRGRVFVADTGNHRVVSFDSAGAVGREFGGFGYENTRFDRPTDVWIGGGLHVWVLDRNNARVVKWDVDGRFVGTVVQLDSDAIRDALGRIDPAGLATDRGGELFLTDRAADRVIVFDPLGAVLEVRGGFGAQAARFADPSGVAVDPTGRLLVGDPGNRRVQLLDSFGGFVRAYPLDFGMTGAAGLSVAFGPDGTWAMADPATGRLACLDASGVVLARHVPKTAGDPWVGAVAYDAQGRIHASDPKAPRILRFRRSAPAP